MALLRPCAPHIPSASSFRLPFSSHHYHLSRSVLPFSNPDLDFFFSKKQKLRTRSGASIFAMAYEKELSVAKKAASLAAQLCRKVQKSLLQSDVQSKTDKTPVTIADYEADGVVIDAAGNPLDFSRGRYLDRDTGIIATNRKLMPLLLDAVQAAVKEKAASASFL